jgi:hypothetical protein
MPCIRLCPGTNIEKDECKFGKTGRGADMTLIDDDFERLRDFVWQKFLEKKNINTSCTILRPITNIEKDECKFEKGGRSAAIVFV